MKSEAVIIQTEFIKLDALLKYTGAAGTGGHAKELIASGDVSVDGEICTQRGRKIRPGQKVAVGGVEYEVQDGAH